ARGRACARGGRVAPARTARRAGARVLVGTLAERDRRAHERPAGDREDQSPSGHGQAPRTADRSGRLVTAHPIDDLAAYALGALDPEEARAIGAHVESCSRCRAELRTYSEAAWSIAESRARDVPPRLRAAIIERA